MSFSKSRVVQNSSVTGMLFGLYCYSGFLNNHIWSGELLEHFGSLPTHAQGETQDRIYMSLNMQLMIQNMFLKSTAQNNTCPTAQIKINI